MKRPPEETPGAVFMPFGSGFVNVLASLIIFGSDNFT
jgi:hypothetical protein